MLKPTLPAALSAALTIALIAGAGYWLGQQKRVAETVTVQYAADQSATRAVGPVSYNDAVTRASPSVVNIYTTRLVKQRHNPLYDDPLFQRFFGRYDNGATTTKRVENSLGSAVIVSADGLLVTNHHVIDGADEIFALLRNGQALRAKLVGTDPDTDIAVLQVDAEDESLPAITFGASENLRVGDVVLAIGNPFGVGKAVTMGIVSATGRSDLGINTFEDFIQTDAAINPGNSGGALINAHGDLVGINTAIFSKTGASHGIGFAIPAQLAEGVMRQIVKHGHAVRGWLGIRVQEMDRRLAESLQLATTTGVLIAGTLRDGPADDAGIEPGDVITHIDGHAIRSANHLLNLIARNAPGSELKLDVVRGKETLALTATTTERPVEKKR